MHKNWVKRVTAGILAIGLAVGPLSVYAEETENSRFDQFMKDRFAEAMSGDYMNMHFMVKDYETYAALVKSLRQEIADLKEELSHKPQVAPTQPDSIEVTASTSMTNFDILKRLNRLEKEVFGKQILDNQD